MPDEIEIVALAANRSVAALAEQIRTLRPARAVIRDESLLGKLKRAAGPVPTELACGEEALLELARDTATDLVFQAMSGAAGLPLSLAAVETGHDLALANKESLVAAGHVLMPLAADKGVRIIPVDSEHSAIMQAIGEAKPSWIKRVIITASGGALFDRDPAQLDGITVDEVLAHPTWSMGRRITVDSATLLNKALEIIEAKWLFDLEPSQIEVVIHRQSIIHSIVEFVDNTMIAQMSLPDMRGPIQYALTLPRRRPGRVPATDLAAIGSLTFERADFARFPALELGYRIIKQGGTSGAVLNAADETAVAAFLDGRISFTRIIPVVREVLDRHHNNEKANIADILAADGWARDEAEKIL